jgi:hemoglobin
MRVRLLVPSIVAMLAVASFVACGPKKQPPKEPEHTETIADAGEEAEAEAPKPKSLYERLGNKEGIAKVVDTFLKNVLADKVIAKRFAKVKKPDELKAKLTDFIAVTAGCSDCKYEGKNMKDAHKGMKITAAEWDAIVQDLGAALEENKVGKEEQNDLVAALGQIRADIVEVEAKPKPGGKK